MKIAKNYQDFSDKIKNIKVTNKSKTQCKFAFSVNINLSALTMFNIKRRAHIGIKLKNW